MVLLFAAALSTASVPAAEAKKSSKRSAVRDTSKQVTKRKRRRRKKKARKGRRVCRGAGDKRRCRWVTYFQGHSVPKRSLRTAPLPKPSGDIHFWSVNFHEEVKVNIYDEGAQVDEAVLAQLDHAFRCRRTKQERAVDPRLYELLSIIYDHFGRKRIELVSGFRFQRNEGSRHFHASAMDLRIPGVSAKKLYKFAETLDAGGMGIGLYPKGGFVHIDFRAPGAKSYRWTDRSPKGSGKGKAPSRQWKRSKRPNS